MNSTFCTSIKNQSIDSPYLVDPVLLTALSFFLFILTISRLHTSCLQRHIWDWNREKKKKKRENERDSPRPQLSTLRQKTPVKNNRATLLLAANLASNTLVRDTVEIAERSNETRLPRKIISLLPRCSLPRCQNTRGEHTSPRDTSGKRG